MRMMGLGICPSQEISGRPTLIVLFPVRLRATPRAISIIARVTMKGGILKKVDKVPLIKPQKPAAEMPARKESPIITGLDEFPKTICKVIVDTTVARATKDPTDRSIPAVMMIIVIPMAMIAVFAVLSGRVFKLLALRKVETVSLFGIRTSLSLK